MKKSLLMASLASVLLGLLLAGCGTQKESAVPSNSSHDGHNHSYKDGTYTAKSSSDERGAVGEVTLTIQQGKITRADYKGIQKDGTIKDLEYGKTNGKIENLEFYKKAQQAVKGAAAYAPRLVETQAVEKVDSVSGATVSYRQFSEAAKLALEQAQ